MHKLNTVLRVAVASAVAAGGLVGFASAPAQAAAPCTYAACNGLDPETTGCSKDAVTKLDLQASLILAELRWSPSCHAFWTRLRWDPANGGIGQYAYIAGGVYDANNKPVTKIVYTSDPEGHPWTKMISQAYPWERFCVFTATDDGCKITNL
ncbi:DUF2690 domain-containing protein [Kribbella sp. NPDC006257]|uniref:DUF2690 domain-containing protein n=1 Tax=Kribbella sp. NPDC006257 TaxID=3156738 RepID=UPI0033BD3E37